MQYLTSTIKLILLCLIILKLKENKKIKSLKCADRNLPPHVKEFLRDSKHLKSYYEYVVSDFKKSFSDLKTLDKTVCIDRFTKINLYIILILFICINKYNISKIKKYICIENVFFYDKIYMRYTYENY